MLTFEEKLDPGTQLTVTGPSGAVGGGAVTVADTTVSVPFAAGAAGQYTVKYRVLSVDGHMDLDAMKFMQDTLLELNVLKQRLPLDQHYTTDFVPVKV